MDVYSVFGVYLGYSPIGYFYIHRTTLDISVMPSHRSVFFTILVIQILLCAVSIAKYVHIVPQNSLTPRSGGLVERYGYRGINLYPVTSTEATGAISSASTTSTSTPTPPTPAKFVKESAIEGTTKIYVGERCIRSPFTI